MELLGELAGISTAVLWAFTSMFFSEAGRRIGSFNVNRIRLLIAVAIYVLVLLLSTGRLVSPGVSSEQMWWLGASGLIGLVFGDSCLFKSFVMIGPRLATLVYSSTPIMTALIAWLYLGETLAAWSLVGISVTVSGITWVVLERKHNHGRQVAADHPDAGSLARGVLLGLGGALGQAMGLVLAKKGMLSGPVDLSPLEASFLRMAAALIGIWFLSGVRGQLGQAFSAMKNLKAVGFAGAGAVVGPFLGVWMSLVAVKLIPAGVASTLNSMVPVAIIPLVVLVHKEKVSYRAVIGALISVGGVAILMLS